MHLRKLELSDASPMYEWMHDESVVEHLRQNFTVKTMNDCEQFITESLATEENLHLAIADDPSDEYLGTVSLKSVHDGIAEFGICLRKTAIGKGIAHEAMRDMIKIGFNKLKIDEIYWCVSKENKRALKFYDKNGYRRISMKDSKKLRNHAENFGGYREEEISSYIWYLAEK